MPDELPDIPPPPDPPADGTEFCAPPDLPLAGPSEAPEGPAPGAADPSPAESLQMPENLVVDLQGNLRPASDFMSVDQKFEAGILEQWIGSPHEHLADYRRLAEGMCTYEKLGETLRAEDIDPSNLIDGIVGISDTMLQVADRSSPIDEDAFAYTLDKIGPVPYVDRYPSPEPESPPAPVASEPVKGGP